MTMKFDPKTMMFGPADVRFIDPAYVAAARGLSYHRARAGDAPTTASSLPGDDAAELRRIAGLLAVDVAAVTKAMRSPPPAGGMHADDEAKIAHAYGLSVDAVKSAMRKPEASDGALTDEQVAFARTFGLSAEAVGRIKAGTK